MLKMIKILIVLFFSTSLFAQFEGTKIMINPGHGGNDSNDRFIEETGFWESESNLTKGLYLWKLLEDRGAEVIMSRTQNRSEDDLDLSVISGIANANQVDFFHSIHSNGFNGNANYSLLLWEGTDANPAFPLAKQMGAIMVDEIFKTNRTTNAYNRGDLSFLGFNLGVLRELNMPGTLSEGSFHDYIPESWRLMNLDYRKHEAMAILRSFLEYFDLAPLDFGAVAGLVRDKSQTVAYNWITSNDRYKPINNIKVSAYADSVAPQNFVKDYVGDFNNNGYFVLDSLQPGPYKLVYDFGKFTPDTTSITVIANRTVFSDLFPDANPDKAPSVFSTQPADNDLATTYSDILITFSRSMNPDSVKAAFSISPSISGKLTLTQSNQILKFTPDSAYQLSTEYQVNISEKAVSSGNIRIEEPYTFTFTTADDHIYPQIVATFPANPLDSIATDKSIRFTFDQVMFPEEVEQAFSIDPSINGAFLWEENNTKVTFDPNQKLLRDTVYTVTFSSSALNSYYIGLEEDYQFQFKTRKRNEVNILASFPAIADTGISTQPEFFFLLDGIPDINTLIGNTLLFDGVGNPVAVRSQKVTTRDGLGVIKYRPRSELERNSAYTIMLLPEIRDLDELPLVDTVMINFSTSNISYKPGTIIDNFNQDSGWLDPESSPTTTGTDPDNTFFSVSGQEKISGSNSGKLRYVFTSDSGGVARSGRFDLYSFSSSADFGIWVFGDYSFNTIELWFDVGSSTDRIVVLDTLDFAGWKLITFPLTQLGSGTKFFQSIVLRQQPGGYFDSEIYVDDAQYGVVTAVKEYSQAPVVKKFNLHQNYPNPFNPTTKIQYDLPFSSDIKLTVYNNLGQQVASLLNKRKDAGVHVVEWDASDLSSGVYFYKLEAKGGGSSFVQTRKLLLLK